MTLSGSTGEHSIASAADLPLDDLDGFLDGLDLPAADGPIATPIIAAMKRRIALLHRLGLGYLRLSRESTTLSGGEAQRIRLATQVGTGLRGILYILDEPSIGLHHRDNRRLLETLAELRDSGNTVVVVEHDEDTIRNADWLVDIGPGAGTHGGEILHSGPVSRLFTGVSGGGACRSLTRSYLSGDARIPVPAVRRPGRKTYLEVLGAAEHNLRQIDVAFRLAAFNVVTGVSGAGKSTLVDTILGRALRRALHRAKVVPGRHREIRGAERINKIIEIDQSPIGRTPRSNPATYTDAFDHIRDLFASLPEARGRGWSKGHFSLNVKGGRCEACQGAGVQTIGMHFLGDVAITCEECDGRRFSDATLAVHYRGKSVRDVLDLPVEDAAAFFADHPKISRILEALKAVGLDYLSLGQPATTLSGGEAQRVKLAAELGRPATGRTLYILDEPTTGLHLADIAILLRTLNRLVDKGNTVIVIEHHLDFIKAADHIVDLGPESGERGGRLVAAGTPEEIARHTGSHTGAALRRSFAHASAESPPAVSPVRGPAPAPVDIELKNVTTHNLKGIDVSFPAGKLSVITGVSGSGKSSLAFDTLYAEGQRCYRESLATHIRRYLGRTAGAELTGASGLTPTIAIGQKTPSHNPRSTVATATEIYDYYRLLYARAGRAACPLCDQRLVAGACPTCGFQGRSPLTAQMFSFNHHQGACPSCKGLGTQTVCDPDLLVTDPSASLYDGALAGHKTGKYYGDPRGQHLAILTAVGKAEGIDFCLPWQDLDARAREIAMYGTGAQRYQVHWHFQRDRREGDYHWETTWDGFVSYVNEEYERKHADRRGESLRPLMKEETCAACRGRRLEPAARAVTFGGRTLGELCDLSIAQTKRFFAELAENGAQAGPDERDLVITSEIRAEILRRLHALEDVGLGYLPLSRGAASLSGGEAQRIRLATQLGSGLCGVTYVLDEPTIGLHARDTAKLIKTLRALCDAGNTIVVVEHDGDVLRAADHLIDLGPGAGRLGGEVVAAGPVSDVMACETSQTGRFLRNGGQKHAAAPRRLDPVGIRITDLAINNLHGDLVVPIGGLVAVTGVSGSGKSSLVFDVIAASASAGRPVGCRGIQGLQRFEQVIAVDQAPVGGGLGSNPATYTGVFDRIRTLFAGSDEARARKYKPSRFSFNTRGGRCEKCQGMGTVAISMDFLADVRVSCDQCHGQRFNAETLLCTYRGATIADVLAMTVDEGIGHFADTEAITVPLRVLADAGLGYVQLGQPTPTLSGGETQRMKLAAELIRGQAEARGRRAARQTTPAANNLYLFDEPTIGLHYVDCMNLLRLFKRLVSAGHSVMVVEHNLELIAQADWVIDLGPEGGDRGGGVVATGTPGAVAADGASHTGRFLSARASR